MFQKIRTVEIDDKIIKLQIVSGDVCVYVLPGFTFTAFPHGQPVTPFRYPFEPFELHIQLNITAGVTVLLVVVSLTRRSVFLLQQPLVCGMRVCNPCCCGVHLLSEMILCL